MMIRRTAFHIVNIAKRRTERLLLLLAMRTPVKAVHHSSLVRKTLSKAIHFLPSAHLTQIPHPRKCSCNEHNHGKLPNCDSQNSRNLWRGFFIWHQCALRSLTSYYDTECLWKHVDAFDMQRCNLTIERDIDRAFEKEVDPLYALAFGHRVVNMLSREETGKISD